MPITKQEIDEMERVRDLAGKNVITMTRIKDIEDGVPQFENGDEDFPRTYTAEEISDYKAKVRNRKKKIREVTDTWPAPN